MSGTGRTVEIDLGVGRGVWFRMPATTEEPHESTTASGSVGLSFTGHRRATVARVSGRLGEIDVAPNSGFVTGGEALNWVRVAEPYEGVEIEFAPKLLRDAAEEHQLAGGVELGDLILPPDPVFWAAGVRLREHALGVRPLGDLEGDALIRSMLSHTLCEHFGGRPARLNGRPLDGPRLARVVDHVDAHLAERLSVSDLAHAASMSANHFHTAFRRTTGLTPHEFVTARRIERARALLRAGHSRGEAARTVGYSAGHAFRRALARFGGSN